MKRAYPDRKKLECQCISTVAFSKNEPELLDSPIWVMLINVVALEMLKAKMPLGMYIHKILSNLEENLTYVSTFGKEMFFHYPFFFNFLKANRNLCKI